MNRTVARLCSAAVLLTTVAACGDKTAETKTSETTVETAAVETAPAVEPVAEPAAAPVAAVSYASLTGDVAKGEKVFGQCKTCHVAEAGVNRVGPSLWGIVGRDAGSVPNFKYSPANKASGVIWTPEELFTYLEAPQKTIKGTYMAFAGLKNPQDRADVIAYLKTRA